MEFPFFLINQPMSLHETVPAMYNELKPGWMLSENLYTLVRNEIKFRERNSARRDSFDFNMLRPETTDLMVTARARLRQATGRDIFTDQHIPGAGKNFITADSVRKGMESYDFFIKYYALRMYAKRAGMLIAKGNRLSRELILEDDHETRWWQHAKGVLKSEGLMDKEVWANMELFIDITGEIYTKTLNSRRRDYERGSAIIEDYAIYHQLPENDPVIQDLRHRTEIEINRAEQIIRMIK
jgi:hypothetical protein